MNLFNRYEVDRKRQEYPRRDTQSEELVDSHDRYAIDRKKSDTQIGELPKLTCSASVGVPTEAWCSRCRRAKNVPRKCRRNLWYAYSNKLAHRSPTPKPTSHCGSPVEKRIPSASAGKPPHKTAVQAFTRLIARPRAIAVALISVAASTGTPTADCLFFFDAVMRCPGLLPPPNQAGFETQSPWTAKK